VGCDSVAILVLKEKLLTTSTSELVICPLQLPYVWNNNVFTGAGTYTVRLTNRTGCDSIATLELLVESPIVSKKELKICTSEIPYLWNGISCSNSGEYLAYLTTKAGCDSVAKLTLRVNLPTTSMKTATVCEGQNYNFNGVDYPAPGIYDVSLMNANGCDSIVTLVLKVSKQPYMRQVVRMFAGDTYSVNGNTYRNEGVYTEVVKSPESCDSVIVTEVDIVKIPNTITPNGDGFNDAFMEGYRVKIYNRNGILLFEGNNGWNGTHHGSPVSSDTYFYVLFLESDSQGKTKDGFITVVR
jgi:gliding motility-associated-like protein